MDPTSLLSPSLPASGQGRVSPSGGACAPWSADTSRGEGGTSPGAATSFASVLKSSMGGAGRAVSAGAPASTPKSTLPGDPADSAPERVQGDTTASGLLAEQASGPDGEGVLRDTAPAVWPEAAALAVDVVAGLAGAPPAATALMQWVMQLAGSGGSVDPAGASAIGEAGVRAGGLVEAGRSRAAGADPARASLFPSTLASGLDGPGSGRGADGVAPPRAAGALSLADVGGLAAGLPGGAARGDAVAALGAEGASITGTGPDLKSLSATAVPDGAAQATQAAQVFQIGAAALPGAPGAPAVAPAQSWIQTPVTQPGFSDEVVVELVRRVGQAEQGPQSVMLHLNPEALGPVSVSIELSGETARIEFGASEALTRHHLEATLPGLAEALREEGVSLVHAQVHEASQDSLSAGTSSGFGGAGSDARSRGAMVSDGRGGSAQPGPRRETESPTGEGPVPAGRREPAGPMPAAGRAGRLDLFA